MLKYHIRTVEVGASGASDISFTGIPQEYSDLEVLISARNGSTQEHLVLTLNNSASGFTGRYVNNGPSTGVYAQYLGNQTRAAYTANTFGNARAVISNYSSSATKLIQSETVAPNVATAVGSWSIVFASNSWASTSPVTSLTLRSESGSNFMQHSSASLYGIKRGSDGKTEVASGGTITTSGGYTIHTFQSSGTFVANRDLQAEALVVAGGGGGGRGETQTGTNSGGGGGGAGGYLAQSLAVSPGSYLVLVGGGGAGGAASNNGFSGTGSSAITLSSVGGGGGGENNTPGGSGGSGGGGGGLSGSAGGAAVIGQGNDGGLGGPSNAPCAGGGGGAGAVGGNGSGITGGVGGAGLQWLNGSFYAGGGGGGGYTVASAGGVGGGGASGLNTGSAVAGTANTGGGGGGSGLNASAFSGASAAGGSGIVIIRYLTPAQ